MRCCTTHRSVVTRARSADRAQTSVVQRVTLLPVLLALVFSSAAFAEEIKRPERHWRSAPLQEDLSKAYGFCFGQQLSLARIADAFPDLRAAVRKVSTSFGIVFRPACDNIERLLKAAFRSEWDGFVAKLRGQLDEVGGEITRADADAFVATVERRASGAIESPILETLLAYNPSFQARPQEEFQRGFTVRYRTAGHPKAKGVDLALRYPRSWGAREGERPNVVQFFGSNNGRGPVYLSLVVKDLRGDVSAAEREALKTPEGARRVAAELFSPQGLAELAQGFGLASQRTLSSARVVIDRWPGAVLDVVGEAERVDRRVTSFNRAYFVVYRHYLLTLMGTVAQLPDEPQQTFKERIAAYDAVFRAVANSVVILSQY